MTADWTTARVVRDGRGRLRTGDGPIRAVSVGEGLGEESAAAFAHVLGPLTPILAADGHPVVRTVGDLAARHIGRRVRIPDPDLPMGTTLLGFGESSIGAGWAMVHLETMHGRGSLAFPLDTPCEVLA